MLPVVFKLSLTLQGGVGKTTTTLNVGAQLARMGHKTLIIDCDPQCNATQFLIGAKLTEPEASFAADKEDESKAFEGFMEDGACSGEEGGVRGRGEGRGGISPFVPIFLVVSPELPDQNRSVHARHRVLV